MKFINVNGVLQRARRFVSSTSGVTDTDIKDEARLADLLRSLQRRVSSLEAQMPPEPLEFEVNVGESGAITSVAHNIGGPVRWFVVQWTQVGGTAYPLSGPMLVQDATSTSRILALRSYVAGKAIVRVEPSFADVDPGITTTPTSPPAANPFAMGWTVVAVTFAAGVAQDVAHNLNTTDVGYFSVRNYGANVANTFGESGVAAADPPNQRQLITTLASTHDILFYRR